MLRAINIFFTDIFVNLIFIIFGICFFVFCLIKIYDYACNVSDVIYCAVNLFFKKFGIYTFFLFFTFFYMIDSIFFYIFLFPFIVSVIFCYRRFENFSVRFDALMITKKGYKDYVSSNIGLQFVIYIKFFCFILLIWLVGLLCYCYNNMLKFMV